jgi:hypothetical protein
MGAVHVKLAMKLPRCFSISTLSRSIAMLFKTITLLVNAIAIENILKLVANQNKVYTDRFEQLYV